MNGMRKSKIDENIPSIYNDVIDTCTRMCVKYRRNYPPEEVFNVAYEYIITIKEKIDSKDTLRRYMTAKCCQEIALNQSSINYTYNKVTTISAIFPTEENTDFDKLKKVLKFTPEEDVIDPYEIELKAIEIYRKNSDRIKRRVFEVYFDEGKNTIRKVAAHFDISNQSAADLINEIKTELNQITIQLKKEQ